MLRDHFQREIERLKQVWPNSFQTPRVTSIWSGCCDLLDSQFSVICDRFINSLKAPPVPDDFIEAARKLEAEIFQRDVDGAAKRVFNWSGQKGLKAFLDKNYPGAETLWDAVTVQRLRLRNGEVTVEELLDHGVIDE